MKFKFIRRMLEANNGTGTGANNTEPNTTNPDEAPDNSNEEDNDNEEKTFTQAEVDNLIKERLKREKKGQPSKEELKAFKEWQENQKTEDEKKNDKLAEAEKKAKDNEIKASNLELKLKCFEAGVSKDSVDDVVALAKAYVNEDTSIEEAIATIVKKYPQFKESEDKGGSWGQKHNNSSKKISGVEEAFRKMNPHLKL